MLVLTPMKLYSGFAILFTPHGAAGCIEGTALLAELAILEDEITATELMLLVAENTDS
jgi:hypothetical protein